MGFRLFQLREASRSPYTRPVAIHLRHVADKPFVRIGEPMKKREIIEKALKDYERVLSAAGKETAPALEALSALREMTHNCGSRKRINARIARHFGFERDSEKRILGRPVWKYPPGFPIAPTVSPTICIPDFLRILGDVLPIFGKYRGGLPFEYFD